MSAMPETDAETENAPPAHKPAFLRRVIIEGYKSIAHCDVTLEPLTIFVGRNASGKSNFLDALSFLYFLTEIPIPVSESISAKDGWKVISDRFGDGKSIRLGVELLWDHTHKPLIAKYEIRLEPGKQLLGETVEESLLIREQSSELEWGFKRIHGKFQEFGDWNLSGIPRLSDKIASLRSLSDHFGDLPFVNIFCRSVFSGNHKLFRKRS